MPTHHRTAVLPPYLLAIAMVFFFVGASVVLADEMPSQPTEGSGLTSQAPRLGTNLRTLDDWSSQRPFLDLFKQARTWFTQCDDTRDADCGGRWYTREEDRLDLDQRGWVRSLPAPAEPGFSIAATLLDLPASFPAGRYLLLYEGEGVIRYRLGARRLDAESAPGRDVLDLDVRRGAIHIQILETDPSSTGNYLRNLRLIREADESLAGTEVFDPDFLIRTEPFQALRLMEWMKINGSPISRWADRPLPDDATWTGPGGVPAEIMLMLANRLGKPVWLNVPHQADDDYVRRFAELTRDQLDPALSVYLEYSNEVWNGLFSQQAWIREQAKALWSGSSPSDYTKVINWYGKRTAEICKIWEETFAGQSERVICVMGAQAANDWTARQALACPLWTAGAPCQRHGIDAIAIAPYFGGYLGKPDYQSELEDWTYTSDGGLDLLFEELRAGGQIGGGPDGGGLLQSWQWIDRYARLAADTGLELLAYEGGQHLVGIRGVESNQRITELFVGLNRDPRMAELYREYLLAWGDSGSGAMMHFSDISTPGPYGSWGALEDVLQSESPKYLALLDHLGVPPADVYLLTVRKEGAGEGSVSGSGSYAAGSTVTPTAIASAGSVFTGWTPAECGGGLTLMADRICTARFEPLIDLKVYKRGASGDRVTGAGIDCGTDCTEGYASGTSVTLVASPGADATFTGWSGDCAGLGDCTLRMDTPKYVNATFQAKTQYRLYVRLSGLGEVISEPKGEACTGYCKYDHPAGTEVTLTATPASGKTFTAWSGACSGVGLCRVTLSEAKSVVATFK